MSPYLLSSTNWFVADGSLEGSISFETSSAEGADVIPNGVLLEMPVDSPPCEITILFREKHEIHSIYVRSTARIYEIFYSSDKRVNSNEYLCTVRCGIAVQEVTAEGMLTDDINAVLPRSDSNNVMLDGWVDVKIPDSFLQDNRRHSSSNTSVENICPKTRIQYEATAEISDASPCISVTLRFLSLEIKTSICVEEIYIYADPVEDTDSDPPVNNRGAGSLLSMLVPSLLQLSKSGTSRLQDKGFSDILEGLKYSTSSEGDSKVRLDQQCIKDKLEHSMLASSKTVDDSEQASKPKADGNNEAHDFVENVLDNPTLNDGKLSWTEEEKSVNQSLKTVCDETKCTCVRLEKMLDDLVSRVVRVETFCSCLEESIVKPLTRIDIRLQQMEKQLDAFTKIHQSSEANPSTMFSCPSVHESDLEPSSHEKRAPVAASLPEFQKSSGLVVKAPEFPNDDDDDESTNSGGSFDLTPNVCTKSQCLSIDNALVSGLSAFLSSATDKVSVNNPHPMDVSNEHQHSADHFLDSADIHPEVDNNSFVEYVLGNENCDTPDEARDELSESDKSYSDVVIPDNILNTFDGTEEAKRQDGCLCVESLLADDDWHSSTEVHTYDPNGLIIKAPEFPNEDDAIHSGEILDPRASSYPDAASYALPDAEATPPLALFLSSRRFSPSKGSPNPLSSFQAHGGLFGMKTSSLERPAHIEHDPSLVGFFLSKDGSEQKKLDSYDHTAILEGEISSLLCNINGMEDGNHVLKCDGFFSDWTSSGLRTDGNSICVQDIECWDGSSNERNAGIKQSKSDFLSRFAVADNNALLSSDSMDSLTAALALLEPKPIPSFFPDQDDFTSYVEFCADKNVRSWLPLEILLDDKTHNGDQLKFVHRNLQTGLRLEVLPDEKSDD